MNEQQVSERLEKIASETLSKPILLEQVDQSREQIPHWDSLGHLMMILKIEEEFCIQLEAQTIESIKTWKQLVAEVKQRVLS